MVIALVIALLLPVFGKWIGYAIFSILGFTEAFLLVWNTLRWIISFCDPGHFCLPLFLCSQ